MKKLLSLLLIICSIGVAYADDKSTVTSLKYVTDELNTRQDKFGANDGKAMTFTNVAGGNLPRDVKASLGTSTSDNGLPTVSAVNTGLENKQDEIGAANTNTVVTYTGTPGTLGQKGIYQDTGTYAAQSDNLIQASTFNAALRNGLENEFVCAGTDDGTPNGNCWLWTIHNEENVGNNLLDLANCTDGYYYSPAGEYTTAASARLSNYIPVKAGVAYTVFCAGVQGGSNVRVNLLDTGKNWLSQTVFVATGGASITKTVTPTQDGFLAFSANFTSSSYVDWSTAQVVQGSYTVETMPEYQPYVEGTVYIPQNQ